MPRTPTPKDGLFDAPAPTPKAEPTKSKLTATNGVTGDIAAAVLASMARGTDEGDYRCAVPTVRQVRIDEKTVDVPETAHDWERRGAVYVCRRCERERTVTG